MFSAGKSIMLSGVAVLALLGGLLLTTSGIALAHGDIEVGKYEIELGFLNEPAYLSEPNALFVSVTNGETHEPVTGLESTLQAEIIFGSSTRKLVLRPLFEQEGSYVAEVLPTRLGDYTMHIWGDIEGTLIDERMTSSPTTFDSVVTKDDIAFPEPELTVGEVQQQTNTALYVGIAGIVIGVLALVLSLVRIRQNN